MMTGDELEGQWVAPSGSGAGAEPTVSALQEGAESVLWLLLQGVSRSGEMRRET